MTTPRATGPQALRAASTAPLPVDLVALHTVHVGQSAVLLCTSDSMLVVVTSSVRGLVPGGFCLPVDADYVSLADLARQHAVLDLSAWEPLLAQTSRTSLAVVPGMVDAEAAEELDAAALDPDAPGTGSAVGASGGGPMDPRPIRREARALVQVAATGDLAAAGRGLHALVGVGPGSTPSGDDVVVGVLAGLDRCGGPHAQEAAALLRAALPNLLDRTTILSRHDLRAVLAGEVAERVHHLLAAVGDPRRVPAAVRAARTWGASSGLDLAAGVAAGALGPTPWAARTPYAPQITTFRTSA